MPSRTITATAAEFLPENRLRRSVIFQNEDASINSFLKLEKPGGTTVSTTDHDHRLGPGGILALNWDIDGKEAVQGRWTIVAASGTPLISFFETEQERR